MIGTRLGEYEVLARLGAGGMGEVYRGRDPRLKREVAIKILTGSALEDPTRRKRFEYEAQAASALNHPNILVIFDIGLHQETPYIVSELVEGETLRNLIQRGAVPSKKLLDLAVQIADGLSAAHKAGIVHRDLKPENILINDNNLVKILDFGLAKMQVPEGQAEEAATISHGLSKTGLVVGTVPYMSPEQASGKNIDFRSDQFSLGLILYEMATGKRAFNRDTPAQTLSAIISEEPPPISTLNPRVPPPLRWLIDQCLTKDSHHRFDSTADLYRELRNVRDHLSETTSEEISPVAVKTSLRKKVMFAALAFIAALAGFLMYPLLFPSSGSNSSKYQFTPLATDAAPEGAPSWSADGESLAYLKEVNGIPQVFTRSLSAPIPAQITKSSAECNNPFWDPDGSRIFYTSEFSLWSANLAGGSPQRMFENVVSAHISPDGKRLALLRGTQSKNRDLWISEPPGAEPKKITNLPGSLEYFIVFTPDSSAIACWINTTKGVSLWLVPYPSGEARMVQTPKQILEGTRFAFVPNSRYIIFGAPYWLEGHLVLLDSESGMIVQPITTGYRGTEFYPAITRDGRRIAFASVENDFDLVEIPLDGSPERVLMATSYSEASPSWAPTGKELVYSGIRDGVFGIWLAGIQEGWTRAIVTSRDFDEKTSITFDNPSFSPDGQRIAYQTKTKEIWVSNVAGGKPIRVVSAEYGADGPSWSPDGNSIVFYSYDKSLIAKVKVGGTSQPQILKERVANHMPRWSPKGDWITYVNQNELSLISPDGKNHRQLSKGNFGITNSWSPDGSTVYILRMTDRQTWELCSIDINTLEINSLNDLGPSRTYLGLSLSPDGKSFVSSKQHLQSDIWMFEGFEPPGGFFKRLFRTNAN